MLPDDMRTLEQRLPKQGRTLVQGSGVSAWLSVGEGDVSSCEHCNSLAGSRRRQRSGSNCTPRSQDNYLTICREHCKSSGRTELQRVCACNRCEYARGTG